MERVGKKTFYILVSCMAFLRFEGQHSFSYNFLYVVKMLAVCLSDTLVFQRDVSTIVQKTLVTLDAMHYEDEKRLWIIFSNNA